MKSYLVQDTALRPRPVSFDERSGHVLPAANNLLQTYIHEAEKFTSENNMKINKDKTNVIKFTFARKLDFPTELTFSDGTSVGNISDISLLGVKISKDLKWTKNTAFICAKARKKLWILHRMTSLDLNLNEMFDLYAKEVRSFYP